MKISFPVLFLSLVLVGTDVLAASQKLNISMVTGDVTFKRGKRNAKPVRKSTRLKAKDIIFTGAESSLEIRLDDGTRFTIEENSQVKLSVFKQKGKTTNSKLRVESGKIIFNVKKLASKKSDFTFETPTATAAIRGTEGGLGSNGDKTYAYLSEGELQLNPIDGGNPVTINGMDVAVQTPLGFEVTQVKDESDLNKAISKIEDDLAEESEKKKNTPANNKPKTREEKKKSKIKVSDEGNNEGGPDSDEGAGEGEGEGEQGKAGGSGGGPGEGDPSASQPTQEELNRFQEELNAPNELEQEDLLEVPTDEILENLDRISPSEPKGQN